MVLPGAILIDNPDVINNEIIKNTFSSCKEIIHFYSKISNRTILAQSEFWIEQNNQLPKLSDIFGSETPFIKFKFTD